MKAFDSTDIAKLDKRFRTHLINSIYGPKPAFLIGTINENGTENLAIFSSIVHLGAHPPLVGFIQRPIMSTSHTYKNIIQNGFYTLNQIQEKMLPNAHFTAVKFDKEISEFQSCGFTVEYSNFKAPYVAESNIQLGVKFIREIPIEENDTRLIIGQIEEIRINENSILENDGTIDAFEAKTVSVIGLETYVKSQKLARYPHPRLENYTDFIHERS